MLIKIYYKKKTFMQITIYIMYYRLLTDYVTAFKNRKLAYEYKLFISKSI